MNWLLQGAHRGGTTVLSHCLARGLGTERRHVCIADPAPGRAEALARAVRAQGTTLDLTAVDEPGHLAVQRVDVRATLLLASDTPSSLLSTLQGRRPEQTAHWQLCGRGSGGASARRFAVAGTVAGMGSGPGAESSLFLGALERLAPPATSRALVQDDAVTAATLGVLRDRVSRHTAARALDAHGPRSTRDGSLTLFGGSEPMRLVAAAAPRDVSFTWRRQAALELVGANGPGAGTASRRLVRVAVALVDLDRPAIHVLTVLRTRDDRRYLAGLHLIEPARAEWQAPAMFTD